MLNDHRSVFQCDTTVFLLTALLLVYINANVLTALMLLYALAYLIAELVAYVPSSNSWTRRIVSDLQLAIVLVAVSSFVVAPTVLFMTRRAESAPTTFAQDSLLQVEAAARFVLAGKNPYLENYYDTPLADLAFSWAGLEVNPALEHFAYTPLSFLLAVPGEGIIRPIVGWYDHRLVLLFSYLVNLVLIKRLAPSRRKANALLIVVGLNPLLLTSYTYGNLNALVFSGWLCTYLFASQERWGPSFLSLALSVAVKQIAVVALPFLLAYWLAVERPDRLNHMLMPIAFFVTPLILFIGPFLLWHPRAFLQDTVLFIVGGMPDSWPISGMSLQAMLPQDCLTTRLISLMRWLVPMPLLGLTSYLAWLRRSLRATLALQAVFFTVLIFLARFVNVEYVGYLLVQLGLSLWIRETQNQPVPES